MFLVYVIKMVYASPCFYIFFTSHGGRAAKSAADTADGMFSTGGGYERRGHALTRIYAEKDADLC